MTKILRSLLPAFLVAGGCASPARHGAGHMLAARFTSVAAAQVKRCYRAPRVPHAGRQIVTRLRVRYAPDGTVAELPVIVSQSGVNPDNQLYAAAMAQAAMASVIRCSPLGVPSELRPVVSGELDLTFSPSAVA